MKITYCAILMLILFKGCECNEENEDVWVEPNAWGREQSLSLHEFSKPVKSNCLRITEEILPANDISLMFFQKFINTLFKREKLQFDMDSNKYKRSLEFFILPEQLEKLEELNDPRDLDVVLTDILSNIRIPKNEENYYGWHWLIGDQIKDFLTTLKSIDVFFFVMVLIVMWFGWFLKKRFRYGYVLMFIWFCLIYEFLDTYRLCNEELRHKQLVEFLEENSAENDLIERFTPWYWKPIVYVFGTSNNSPNKSQNLRTFKPPHSNYCSPYDVSTRFINKLIFTYLNSFIMQLANTSSSLYNSLPFPINYAACIFVFYISFVLLTTAFPLIFTQSAWAETFHKFLPSNNNGISKETLKVVLEHMSERDKTYFQHIEANRNLPRLATSGVEEITYTLKSVSSPSPAAITAVTTSSQEHLNKTETEQHEIKEEIIDLTEMSKVMVEDITGHD